MITLGAARLSLSLCTLMYRTSKVDIFLRGSSCKDISQNNFTVCHGETFAMDTNGKEEEKRYLNGRFDRTPKGGDSKGVRRSKRMDNWHNRR